MFKHYFKPTDRDLKVGDIIAFDQGRAYGWSVGIVQSTYTSYGKPAVKVLAYQNLNKRDCEFKAALIRDGRNGHTLYGMTATDTYLYTPDLAVDQARGAIEMYDALIARLTAKKEA